ncbi:MAG: metallophosphatase family protein [Anaerolineae bacterium]|nr:metallophosphatase family protein [Anaerolineae bacterium]
MRVLVITDIHGNQVALETVIKEADGFDAVWCLGDVVGYGPNPNECLEIIKSQPDVICLMGNHDAASIERMDISSFNPEARRSVEWTRSVLTKENIEYLNERPQTAVIDQVTLAHGSPREPVFEYLLDTRAATENFDHFDNDFCFVGHTHLPVLFSMEDEDYMANLTIPPINSVTQLNPRSIINPGSVGQPRDRDPRAAYAIFDTEENTWDYHRVNYNIAETQKRMTKVDLPERHIYRLESGW